MDVSCMHFCEDYAKGPDGTYDLVGIFNALIAPAFPWHHTFWLYVRFDADSDDQRFRTPVSIRTTGPQGDSFTWKQAIELKRPRGLMRPHVWWCTRLDAVFDRPGYYHFAVSIDGLELASDRILVRATSR